jgi:hypothetical protein
MFFMEFETVTLYIKVNNALFLTLTLKQFYMRERKI